MADRWRLPVGRDQGGTKLLDYGEGMSGIGVGRLTLPSLHLREAVCSQDGPQPTAGPLLVEKAEGAPCQMGSKLSEFELDNERVAIKSIPHADALSRAPVGAVSLMDTALVTPEEQERDGSALHQGRHRYRRAGSSCPRGSTAVMEETRRAEDRGRLVCEQAQGSREET